MAGNITLKTGTPIVLQDNTSLVVTGSAAIIASASICGTSVFDNTTQLMEIGNFGFSGSFALAPSASSEIQLFLVPTFDGSNYQTLDLNGSNLGPNTYAQSWFTTTTASAGPFWMSIEGVPLSPVKYQAYIVNRTQQSISAGWQVVAYPYAHQYT